MLSRLPGALMVIPLLVGALLNTLDQAHLWPVEYFLEALGTPPVVDAITGESHYEILAIGGFTSSLAGAGATTLIAMFLVCVASQMDFRVGRRALHKGIVVTATKLVVAVASGYLLATLSNEFEGFLGLSLVAVVAAMSNGNGGLYLALTGQYGERSDVGAVAVISLNDGPFFTLLALGMLGERFPIIALLAVLIPMLVGFVLGQISDTARDFLRPGEILCIPFFAFALGTTMSFAHFLRPEVLAGGLFLGFATVLLTGFTSALMLRLSGERSVVAGLAEASTAGNAVQTPLAVSLAAAASVAAGTMSAERAGAYEALVPTATAQISISTITTALLCPLVLVIWHSRFGASSTP